MQTLVNEWHTMNFRKISYPILTICSVIVVFFMTNAQAKTDLEILVVGNHAPPYRIIKNGVFSGIYFDVMNEVGSRLKVPVKFNEQPFKRALRSMRNGTADVMVGPNKTKERESYMVYTKAMVGRANKAFYVNSEDSVIRSYSDLKGKKIITHRGKVYSNKFDQDDSLEKFEVTTYAQAIGMVSLGRANCVIMPENEGDYLLKEMGVNLVKSPFIFEGNQSFITISKKSPILNLKHQIESTVDEMNADGTMEMILGRYRLNP